MGSRFIYRLRRSSRLLFLVVFATIGLGWNFRMLGAEFEFYLAKNVADTPQQALFHLHRARTLWPYDYQMRTAPAYYFTAFRQYENRKIAIDEIEKVLAVNPYSADLWVALAAYKLSDGDEKGAEEAVHQVQRLRPGITFHKE